MYTQRCDYNDINRIKKIYLEAFPWRERKPVCMLKSRLKKGEYELFILRDNDIDVALMIAVPNGDVVMLDYLAVDNSIRGKGYGSKILGDVAKYYKGKRLFLVAEETGDIYSDNDMRLRRLAFYQRNGWVESGMVSVASSGRLKVLILGGNVTEDEFMATQLLALGRVLIRLSKMHIEYTSMID